MCVSYSNRLAQAFLAATLWLSPVAFALATNAPAAKPATLATRPAAPATTNAASVEVPIPQSVFIVPSSHVEGVDPFFPLSTRLIVAPPTTSTNKPAQVAQLVINGLSGTPERPLVIINGITFGLGDKLDLPKAQGRTRVRCLEINLNDETAIVEVNGERRALRFRGGK